MFRSKFLAAAGVATAIFLAELDGAEAAKYALLVGVSAYPSLPENLHLRGPSNDVDLMRTTLLNLGYPHNTITVLADGLPGAQPPTRDAILAQFDALAERVGPGDEVVVQIAGHGARQPAKPEDVGTRSLDGFDAIVLPRDVGAWRDDTAAVDNAIVNREVRERLERLRDRGAFVWLIFDACHSANMTRAAVPEGMRFRQVAPGDLGIPETVIAAAERRAPHSRGQVEPRPPLAFDAQAASGASQGRGDFVAFFAAQSTERTPEFALPRYHEKAKPHGLFTFTIAQAIATNPTATFGQLAQQVLHLYAAGNYSVPTPLFAGTGLSRPITGGVGDSRPQWLLRRDGDDLTVSAGALHMLGGGSRLAVLPNAMSSEAEALGYAEVVHADVTESTLRLVEHSGRPALNVQALPAGAVARLIEPKLDVTLRVSRPATAPGTVAQADLDTVRRVVEGLDRAPDANARVQWVDANADADVRLLIRDNRLWLLPTSAVFVPDGPNRTLAITLDKTEAALRQALGETLAQIGKVVNLSRLTAQLDGSGLADIETRITVRRHATGATETISDGSAIPTVHDRDQLNFTLVNKGDKPVDVTILNITSRFGVRSLFPQSGESNRIEPHGQKKLPTIGFRKVRRDGTPADTGTERLMVIAIQAEPGQPRADFTFLEQPSLPQERGRGTPIQGLLETVGFAGSATRDAERVPPTALDRSWMRLFTWNFEP